MIGQIAVRPAGRWRIWQPLARRWRGGSWWHLGALARHGDEALPQHPVRMAGSVAGGIVPDPRVTVDALYQQHARAVLGYLYTRLPDLADAEDALGEVFVAALQACAAGAAPDLSWLLLVARRRAADFYRARARGARLTTAAPTPTTSNVPDPRPQPDEVALREEEMCRLRALVAALPEEQREALALRFAAGLRAPQIGTVLGKREDAVRALLSRAVRRLRQEWRKEETR